MNTTLEPQPTNNKTLLTTDWHCHILPGIDDGPTNIDESVAMARALYKRGFRRVYCTPHLIRGSFEADNVTVMKTLLELTARLEEENIHLELLPGREYYLDEFFLDYLKEPMTLGETKYILAEIPNHMDPIYVKEICFRIKCSGYTPMIAHPERCELFDLSSSSKNGLREWFRVQRSRFNVTKQTLTTPNPQALNSFLNYLIELGCRFQGNLGSFVGRYGEAIRTNAEYLRDNKVYACFGSDAHSTVGCSCKVAIDSDLSQLDQFH